MAGPFSGAQDSIGGLTQALALLVAHVAGAGELAVLAKPSIITDTAATRTEALASTDLPIYVLTLAVITLTVLSMNTAVSWRLAGTLATQALSSSKAG